MRSRRRAWPTLIILLVGASCLPLLTAAPGETTTAAEQREPVVGEPVISPGEAKRLVRRYWPIRERAHADNDVIRIDALEAGPAREFDRAVAVDVNKRQLIGVRWERPYTAIDVVVPRQGSYPAYFLAEVVTKKHTDTEGTRDPSNRPYFQMLVFTRKSASAPWKVSLDTGFLDGGPEHFFQPYGDGDGSYAGPPVPIPWIDQSTLHPEFAEYWQHWADLKAPPAPDIFAPGYWTNERGEGIAAEGDRAEGCDCGVDVRYWADPSKDGLWVFPIRHREVGIGNLVCSTVRLEETFTADPGDVLVQAKTPWKRDWGGLLPPGRYREVIVEQIRQSCILAVPAGPPVHVIGGDGDFVRMEGRPASK